MTILFWIGSVIWLAGAAAIFVSRVARRRGRLVLLCGLVPCAVGSIILAVTTPAIDGDSVTMNVLFCIMAVGLAAICGGAALVMVRHRMWAIED